MKAKAAALFAALALCGCARVPQKATAETPFASMPAATPQTEAANRQEADAEDAAADTTVEEFIKASPYEEKARLLKVWRREPGRDRYRLARAGDFKLNESVRRLYYWRDVETALKAPYDHGDFDGSGMGGLVVLVADRTKAEPGRFGVILFVDDGAKHYELHWLYRDADFSTGCTVNRHSGNVYLDIFDAAGEAKFCDIKWDGRARKFICKSY